MARSGSWPMSFGNIFLVFLPLLPSAAERVTIYWKQRESIGRSLALKRRNCVSACRDLSALAAPSTTLHLKEKRARDEPQTVWSPCSLFLSGLQESLARLTPTSQKLTPIQSVTSSF
ncbi:hypothetical protein B0T14DRAFT_15220 [Immersiella caudata]|uniref:Secreted protein n=1 Tax=Immersiella caudata TaxID=314043 RepID=A0AA39XDW7_9PEZI|nr:hypothetical protein B0T14DRAFT_15220 [Immersiella caudata]